MLKKLFTVRNLVILLAVVALFVVSGLVGLKVPPPHVALAAEPLFHLGGFTITNALLTTWIVMIILILAAFFATRRYPKDLDKPRTVTLSPAASATLSRWWSRDCTASPRKSPASGSPSSSRLS